MNTLFWVIVGVILLIPFIPLIHELFRIPLGIVSSVSGKYGWIWFHIFWFMRPPLVFDTTLTKLEKKVNIKKMTIDELFPTLKSGDLLFDISRNELGVYCGLKWGSGSVVTHAAIINIEQNEPWILEAVTEGIRYIPLRESLKLYGADIVFIRRLDGERTPDFEDIIANYIENHRSDKHKVSDTHGMWEMISAAIDPKFPFTSKEILINHRNTKGLFCSELVAQVLMEEDILPDDKGDKFPDSNEYVPADFTSFCVKKQNTEYITLHNNLKHGYKLGEEVFIDYDQKSLRYDDTSLFRF